MNRPVTRVYPPGYGIVQPGSDYRPMDVDEEFLRIYRLVRETTLVDVYRLYDLWELVGQATKRPGDLLEVGVWRGGSGAVIGERVRRDAPGRKLFLADTFSGVVKAGSRDPYYRGGEHADTTLESVTKFLHNADLVEFRLLSGVFPDETGPVVTDHRFCFCHIDVDVYESAKGVFEWIMPRLVPGGIVVFDDYGFLGCEGVTALVHELRTRDDIVFLMNVNGHATGIRLY